MSKPVEIRDGKKKCSVCGECLDLERFTPSALGVGGRQSCCKPCYNERRRLQRHLGGPVPEGPLAARRSCLRCGRMFASAGPANRICPPCAEADGHWPKVYKRAIHATT